MPEILLHIAGSNFISFVIQILAFLVDSFDSIGWSLNLSRLRFTVDYNEARKTLVPANYYPEINLRPRDAHLLIRVC